MAASAVDKCDIIVLALLCPAAHNPPKITGWNKYSVGFFSADGSKCHNQPWHAQSYGPAYVQGDVVGVGYRPRTGTVFFTRNGKKFEDAYVGLHRHNFFPTVGADGPAELHVNLGQSGFVFIEANVKKWGLAPMVGTLAPPPAYGHEGGSILIEAGQSTGTSQQSQALQQQQQYLAALRSRRGGYETPPPPISPNASPADSSQDRGPRGRGGAGSSRRSRPTSIPQLAIQGSSPSASGSGSASSSSRASREEAGAPLEGISIQQPPSVGGAPTLVPRARLASGASDDQQPHNPPTPNALDISMHSLPRHFAANGGGGVPHRLSSPPPYSLDDDGEYDDDRGSDDDSGAAGGWFSRIPLPLPSAFGFGGKRRVSPTEARRRPQSSESTSAAPTSSNLHSRRSSHSQSQSRNRSRTTSVTSLSSVDMLLRNQDPDAPHPTASRVPSRGASLAASVYNTLQSRGLLTPLSSATEAVGDADAQRRAESGSYFPAFSLPTATAGAGVSVVAESSRASPPSADPMAAYERATSSREPSPERSRDSSPSAPPPTHATSLPAGSTSTASDSLAADVEAQTRTNTQSNSRSSSSGSAATGWLSSLFTKPGQEGSASVPTTPQPQPQSTASAAPAPSTAPSANPSSEH